MNSNVIVISQPDSARLCAASAKVSTTEGTAKEIYETSVNEKSNINLINKVVASGHDSVIEHTVFTLVFSNVSAIVEQFFIGFRLASFTVKSRRYVDFGNMGFYTPDFLYSERSARLKQKYDEHMGFLFSSYNQLISKGVSKEDARFVLPYCFYSNFYCTLNARELVHIVSTMLTDTTKKVAELYRLGMSIKAQIEQTAPYVSKLIEHHISERNCKNKPVNDALMNTLDTPSETSRVIPTCQLLSHSPNPGEIIAITSAMLHNKGDYGSAMQKYQLYDKDSKIKLFSSIIKNEHARELEQATFTFIISNLSLAGLTHITRHRMQSIMIPSLFELANVQNYICPVTITEKNDTIYFECFKRNIEKIAEMKDLGAKAEDLVYYYLSGNTVDSLITTMNARSLLGFIKLRACNRAQWEVRDIAISMLRSLRQVDSTFFSNYGPSCYVKHRCPEGRLHCGKMVEVLEYFQNL